MLICAVNCLSFEFTERREHDIETLMKLGVVHVHWYDDRLVL